MTIPSEINLIVDQLNRELDEIEQIAVEGQNISRLVLDRFPNNARLVQFFATFIMTSSRISNDDKKQALGEALELAEEIKQKIEEFMSDSAKTAEKWQKKAESNVEDE